MAVLLAALAGLRAGEILGLQWGDIRDGALTIRRAVDRDTGGITTPKHDRDRHVPLSPRLQRELASLPRRGLWVVSRRDRRMLGYVALHEQIVRLDERAEVTRSPKPIHGLRHTFGTEVAARGVPLPVVQELMGHSDIATTRGYVHVNDAQKYTAIADVFGRPKPGPNAASPKEEKPANR